LLLAIGLTLAIVLYSRAQLLSDFSIMLAGRADSKLAVIHDAEDENKTTGTFRDGSGSEPSSLRSPEN